jgi:hypothetical protein
MQRTQECEARVKFRSFTCTFSKDGRNWLFDAFIIKMFLMANSSESLCVRHM